MLRSIGFLLTTFIVCTSAASSITASTARTGPLSFSLPMFDSCFRTVRNQTAELYDVPNDVDALVVCLSNAIKDKHLAKRVDRALVDDEFGAAGLMGGVRDIALLQLKALYVTHSYVLLLCRGRKTVGWNSETTTCDESEYLAVYQILDGCRIAAALVNAFKTCSAAVV